MGSNEPTLRVKLSPSLYGEWSGGGWPQGQDEGPDGRGTAPLEKMSGPYRTLFVRMGGGGGGVPFEEQAALRGAIRSGAKLERELREFLAANGHQVDPSPGL